MKPRRRKGTNGGMQKWCYEPPSLPPDIRSDFHHQAFSPNVASLPHQICHPVILTLITEKTSHLEAVANPLWAWRRHLSRYLREPVALVRKRANIQDKTISLLNLQILVFAPHGYFIEIAFRCSAKIIIMIPQNARPMFRVLPFPHEDKSWLLRKSTS